TGRRVRAHRHPDGDRRRDRGAGHPGRDRRSRGAGPAGAGPGGGGEGGGRLPGQARQRELPRQGARPRRRLGEGPAGGRGGGALSDRRRPGGVAGRLTLRDLPGLPGLTGQPGAGGNPDPHYRRNATAGSAPARRRTWATKVTVPSASTRGPRAATNARSTSLTRTLAQLGGTGRR